MAINLTHTLNMGMQSGKLRSVFSLAQLSYNQNHLNCKYTVTPSPLSCSYEIRINYKLGSNPDVYVVNPKLALYPGKASLPHVYSTEKQWLCIYYRKAGEWKSSMYIADTILNWTSEWLLHYECWLATGEWHGGGIPHGTEIEKQKS